MKIAALDLGSNTFLMLIAVVNNGAIEEVLVDKVTVTRLGQGVHENKRFHEEALARADQCLENYAAVIGEHGVDKVVAVATSAARDVENKEELLAIGQKWNIPISIISGDEEACLTYRGSTFDLKSPHEYAVIDVGGGSTEVLGVDREGQVRGCSVDVGSVRLTEMFIRNDPITKGEMRKVDSYIDRCLQEKKTQIFCAEKVVAVAGTPTTLAAVVQEREFSETTIHGYRLTLEQIIRYRKIMMDRTLELRKQMKGMDRERADVIVVGTSILKGFIEFLGASEVYVSTKGVRYGLALTQ